MNSTFFADFLEFCYNLYIGLGDFAVKIVDFFSTKLVDIPFGDGVLGSMISELLGKTPFGNLSMLSFILGGGIAIYLGYQLLTWLLNVVT